MKITLQKAVELLNDATAVIVDEHALVYPAVDPELTGDGDNQFGYVSWEDAIGDVYSSSFREDINQTPELDGADLTLYEMANGDPVKLTLLKPWNAETEIEAEDEYERISQLGTMSDLAKIEMQVRHGNLREHITDFSYDISEGTDKNAVTLVVKQEIYDEFVRVHNDQGGIREDSTSLFIRSIAEAYRELTPEVAIYLASENSDRPVLLIQEKVEP